MIPKCKQFFAATAHQQSFSICQACRFDHANRNISLRGFITMLANSIQNLRFLAEFSENQHVSVIKHWVDVNEIQLEIATELL